MGRTHRTALLLVLLPGLAAAEAAASASPVPGATQGVAVAPTLVFTPSGGTVTSGSNITISALGGTVGGSASYACTPSAGHFVTNGSGTLASGDPARTLQVSCPANVPDGPLSCTRTGGDPTPVELLVDCPAIGLAMFSSPPSGVALTCDGAAGSTETVAVTLFNVGSQNVSGLGCSASGPGFSLVGTPSASLLPGASTTATVACTVPTAFAAANVGSLSCSAAMPASAGVFLFPITSLATSYGSSATPRTVPVASPAGALILAGLLLGLGAGALNRRRR